MPQTRIPRNVITQRKIVDGKEQVVVIRQYFDKDTGKPILGTNLKPVYTPDKPKRFFTNTPEWKSFEYFKTPLDRTKPIAPPPEKIKKQRNNADYIVEGTLSDVWNSWIPPNDIIPKKHKFGIIDYREQYNYDLRNTLSDEHWGYNEAGVVKNAVIKALYDLFEKTKKVLKVNLSFAYVLKKKTLDTAHIKRGYTGYYRLYQASENTRLFEIPFTITNRDTMKKLIEKIKQMNLEEFYSLKRPNTGWLFWNFIGFTIYKTPMNYAVAHAADLPQEVKSKRNCMNHFLNEGDHLCFWRCLAKFFNPDKEANRCTATARALYSAYYTQDDYNNYHGINPYEFDDVEKFFKINIDIFQWTPEIEKLIRRSPCDYEHTMHLNLFEDDVKHVRHFSLIYDIELYCKSYKCQTCDKLFDCKRDTSTERHKCQAGKPTLVFKGGMWQLKKTVFDLIRDAGIKINKIIIKEKKVFDYVENNVVKTKEEDIETEVDDVFYDFISSWDFEALLMAIEAELQQKTEKTKIFNEHLTLSCSICSNMQYYNKPLCLISKGNTDELYTKIAKRLIKYGKNAYKLMKQKFKYLFEAINQLEDKKLAGLLGYKLNKFCLQMPVIGFNSSKYDMNLVKDSIIGIIWQIEKEDAEQIEEWINETKKPEKRIKIQCDEPNAIKSGNKYKVLSTKYLKFLDIRDYIDPTYNLDAFLKAYGCKLVKGKFPYFAIANLKRLDETDFFTYQDFYDPIKKKYQIKEKEYNRLYEEIWLGLNMKTKRDYLVWYNNLDVEPLIEACEKLMKIYNTERLDMFKDAVAISSLMKTKMGRILQSKNIKLEIPDNELLDKTLRSSIVGGYSGVYCRYQEKGITRIRGQAPYFGKKLCAGVIGKDCNGLYLWGVSQDMPCEEVHWYSPMQNRLKEFIDRIIKGEIFGWIVVDMHVPDNLIQHFEEFPPIFKNTLIGKEDLGEGMNEYMQNHEYNPGRKLVQSMFSVKQTIGTPLIKWYLENGLIITKIHEVIQFTPKNCFAELADNLTNGRRQGDKDPSKKIISDTCKLQCNNLYAAWIMNKTKHLSVKYVKGQKQFEKHLNDARYVSHTVLNDDKVEMVKQKKIINMDLPLQIGCMVYCYAKLRMLQFYYDFLDKYFDRNDWQLMETDTDSLYFAVSDMNMDNLVKPHLRAEYEIDKYNFFPRDQNTDLAKYDERTRGLFKTEWSGDGMICICAKMYHGFGGKGKDSCKLRKKGCQVEKLEDDEEKSYEENKKARDEWERIEKDKWLKILETQDDDEHTNSGIRIMNGKLTSYKQTKVGLSFKFDKRRLLNDTFQLPDGRILHGINTNYLRI